MPQTNSNENIKFRKWKRIAARHSNACFAGSEYGVPPALKQALQHGYIHPNLAPPKGFHWKCRGGSWRLAQQGG